VVLKKNQMTSASKKTSVVINRGCCVTTPEQTRIPNQNVPVTRPSNVTRACLLIRQPVLHKIQKVPPTRISQTVRTSSHCSIFSFNSLFMLSAFN
jgi:hypothetical protein